jgi:hypothetical protein
MLDAAKARIRKPPVKQDRTGSKGFTSAVCCPRHGLPARPAGEPAAACHGR